MFRALRRRLFAPSIFPRYRVRLELEPLEDRLVLSTFYVTSSADTNNPGSIRYAISHANAAGDGSVVQLTPSITNPIINLTQGELSITANMTIRNTSNAPLEIRQTTAGARVFEIGANATSVTMTGDDPATPLTLDGGSVSGANGGGILVDGSSTTLTLNSVNVVGNQASAANGVGGNGGGIYSAGLVVLQNSLVGTTAAPNSASGQGGGVWAGTGLSLTGSSILGNQAGSDGGGVVVNDGNVSLTYGSSVDFNQAANGLGGGIDVAVGSVFVSNSSHVDGNLARDVGGILVGSVAQPGNDAVDVLYGSTVNGNQSTATLSVSTGDFGGGGIAAPTTGNVTINASQVCNNHSVGMYSGGIVVGLGNVVVTNGSQVNGNTNNGPGGGIAANFGGVVTVTGFSQVDDNTGAAIGGGIVNFAGPLGGVILTEGSQVNSNVLTNAETLPQAIGVFLQDLALNGALAHFASSAGGPGGSGLLGVLQQTTSVATPLVGQLETAVNLLGQGPLVTGGGIGTLLAPIALSWDSQVVGNAAGTQVSGGTSDSVGTGGGLFSVLGSINAFTSWITSNIAEQGNGGGIYNGFGATNLFYSYLGANLAAGNGGGIYNAFGIVNPFYSYIDGNFALGSGGGIYNASGLAYLTGSSVSYNVAAGNGGGVWNGGGASTSAAILSGNQAGTNGGGLFNSLGASAYLTDSLFLANEASQLGAAILNLGSLHTSNVAYIGNAPPASA